MHPQEIVCTSQALAVRLSDSGARWGMVRTVGQGLGEKEGGAVPENSHCRQWPPGSKTPDYWLPLTGRFGSRVPCWALSQLEVGLVKNFRFSLRMG